MRTASLWLAVSAAATTLWASYVPTPARGRLDAFSPFTQLVAARPLLAGALAVVAVVGVACSWRRRSARGAFMLLLICAAAACAQIAPRAFSRAAAAPAGAPEVTVLAANTRRSGVAPGVIVDLVRRTGADVVALPETNAIRAREYARALTAASRERWAFYSDGAHRSDDGSAAPTALLARAALGPRRLRAFRAAPGAHGRVEVRLTRARAGSAGGPTIVAVHPYPPPPAGSQLDWRRDLLGLRALCRTGRILAGDFNATVDHSPMRALLHAGCSDAASDAGQGLRTTWGRGALSLAGLSLDHVLTSGRWRPAGAGILPLPGSDHRAVWARIALQQRDDG